MKQSPAAMSKQGRRYLGLQDVPLLAPEPSTASPASHMFAKAAQFLRDPIGMSLDENPDTLGGKQTAIVEQLISDWVKERKKEACAEQVRGAYLREAKRR